MAQEIGLQGCRRGLIVSFSWQDPALTNKGRAKGRCNVDTPQTVTFRYCA